MDAGGQGGTVLGRPGREGRLSEDFPMLGGLTAGTRIAGYRIEEPLGAGGMAAVYRARDERLDRLVALKILAPSLAADEEFRRRFTAESRAAAAVDHPHIIPVYEAGHSGGALFIAMRLVTGGDLRQVLAREGPLPPERAVQFLSPVASALDTAHRAGLVHRDVKPANILVDAQPDRPDHVYLSDFGISKSTTSSAGLTGTGRYLGTPEYTSPEQAAGHAVDGRADQYALACIAWHLLTGTVPFQRDQGLAVLLAHLNEPPPQLADRRPDLPTATGQVLARALAKQPGERYTSCGEFTDALREALALPPYRPMAPVAAAHPRTAISAQPAHPVLATEPGSPELVVNSPTRDAVVTGQHGWPEPGQGTAPARPARRRRLLLMITAAGALLAAAAAIPLILASQSTSQPPTGSPPTSVLAASPAASSSAAPVQSAVPVQSSPAPVQSATALAHSAAAPVPSVAAPSTPSACPTHGLKVTLSTPQRAAGSSYLPIEFTNTSGATCTLYGYPGVSMLAGTPLAQVGAAAERSTAQSPSLVTLAPGQTASALLRVVDALNFPQATCSPTPTTELRVYPPNQTAPVDLPFKSTGCASNSVKLMTIRVVQPGNGS